MDTTQRFGAFVMAIALFASNVMAHAPDTRGETSAPAPAFIENLGQWPEHVAFGWQGRGVTAWLGRGRIDMLDRTSSVGENPFSSTVFDHAGAEATVEGARLLPGVVNFFIGTNDRHAVGARRFERVVMRGADGGNDVEFWTDSDGRLRSSSAPSTHALANTGTNGELPGLEWSTIIGGSNGDGFADITVGPTGDVVAAGRTFSMDFPATPGAFDESHGGGGLFPMDAIIVSYAADGSTLNFATHLGGLVNDEARGVHVDDRGIITVGGWTASDDFPITEGAVHFPSFGEAFATKFSPDGASLIWSAAAGDAVVHDIDVAANGDVVLVGCTFAFPFPATPGAFQESSQGGGDDAFVMRISAAGDALVFATYLGGSGDEDARAVTILEDDTILVSGRTKSLDFPTTPGAFSTDKLGGYIAHLSADGSSLISSTFADTGNIIWDLDTDGANNVYIIGTRDNDLAATPGAFDETFNGGADGYVMKYTSDLSAVLYATYLGGGGLDSLDNLHVDRSGVATVFGSSRAFNFPVTPGSTQPTKGGVTGRDAIVARLSPDGSNLWYGTFLGGSEDELPDLSPGSALHVGPEGEVIVGSSTTSPDFPTTTAPAPAPLNGLTNAFLAKLTLLPDGVKALGPSTPASHGPLTQYVTAYPQLGASAFGFACSNAPPASSAGFLVVGTPVNFSPVLVSGADLWVDVHLPFARVATTSNDLGYSIVSTPVPAVPSLAGIEVATQFYWSAADGSASTSNALTVTLQP